MESKDVIRVFQECDAIQKGHFILTSGLHSPVYLHKAKVFMYPDKTDKLCGALADKIRESNVEFDVIVSPAVGGLIPGYETARHLKVEAMWVERENGKFKLSRFELPESSKVLIVEDIVTTGLSIRETIECIEEIGATVVAGACLIDRSGGGANIGVPLIALAEYEIPTYTPKRVPKKLQGIEPVYLGSRHLAL